MSDYDTCITKIKESTDYLYEAKSNKKDDISGDYSSDSDSYPTVKSVKSALSSKADTSSLSSYVQKSQTTGLLKNDGSIDTTSYISSLPSASTSTQGIVQLVDNLTTSDDTKALTAKQGKALADLIGDAITYINQ